MKNTLKYGKIMVSNTEKTEKQGKEVLDMPRKSDGGDFITRDLVREILPKREKNTHKGSYGRAVLLCGSEAYRGAAILAAESALRMGSGLVCLCSESVVISDCCIRLPEAIYTVSGEICKLKLSDFKRLTEGATAILIGCGTEKSEALGELIISILGEAGVPLVIDADGINSLALLNEKSIFALKNAKRQVVLTPHPAEMGRLLSMPVSTLQENRLKIAEKFAKENNVTLVLKGNKTIVTDGESLKIDGIGGPELAKGGSGDVLAGAITSFLSQGITPMNSAVAAVYLHSEAGRTLSDEYSEYGVCPSELPKQMAREIALLASK